MASEKNLSLKSAAIYFGMIFDFQIFTGFGALRMLRAGADRIRYSLRYLPISDIYQTESKTQKTYTQLLRYCHFIYYANGLALI